MGDKSLGMKLGATGLESKQKGLTELQADIAPPGQTVPDNNGVNPERMKLNGEVQMGPMKLKSGGKFQDSEISNVTVGGEVDVLPGQSVSVQAETLKAGKRGKPPTVGWSSVALGTRHRMGSLSLNTKVQLDDKTGLVDKYGGGVSYELLPGFKLNAEADSTANLKFGFGYKTQF